MKTPIKRIAESAMLIAIGTVLSLFTFTGPWAFGGGITVCSMLPLVMIAQRYGTPWGIFSALVYSLLQMFLGISNVQCATNFLTGAGIVLLDYVLAFSAVGCSACFNGVIKDRKMSIAVGIVVTFTVRLLCHFLSGYLIWDALFPNEMGMSAAIYSIAYNSSYMIPEIIITVLVALISYKPLEKYWTGADLTK